MQASSCHMPDLRTVLPLSDRGELEAPDNIYITFTMNKTKNQQLNSLGNLLYMCIMY